MIGDAFARINCVRTQPESCCCREPRESKGSVPVIRWPNGCWIGSEPNIVGDDRRLDYPKELLLLCHVIRPGLPAQGLRRRIDPCADIRAAILRRVIVLRSA